MPRTRYALVGDILNLIDANTTLENRVDSLVAKNNELYRQLEAAQGSEVPVDDHLAEVRRRIYRVGLESLYEKHRWNRPGISFKETGIGDTAILEPTPFDEWRERKVDHDELPPYMSADDFYLLMDEMLRAEYDEKVHRAMESRLTEAKDDE